MQATPKNVDLETIQQSLENIQGIDNIHHLHIWNLNDSQVHFECHADVADDIRISETEILQQQIESILHEKFEINHVTIQFEYNCCSVKELIKHHKH
jgi:cobalt-zinc-cadmium efflux system protein